MVSGRQIREDAYGFIATEYLVAADKVVDELPHDEHEQIPDAVWRGAVLLADKLDEGYMRTMYKLSQKGRVESFDRLLKLWAVSDTAPASKYQKISFIERSPVELQAATFNALGPEKSVDLASRSSKVQLAYDTFMELK